jgi:hypothetical protein
VSLLSECDLARDLACDRACYFTAKIDTIRASTVQASPPNIEQCDVPENLSDLRPATADELAAILLNSPAKQCQLDRAPTWLIKRAIHILAPVIATMCNVSFQQEKLPSACNHATIIEKAEPESKRSGLVSSYLKSQFPFKGH